MHTCYRIVTARISNKIFLNFITIRDSSTHRIFSQGSEQMEAAALMVWTNTLKRIQLGSTKSIWKIATHNYQAPDFIECILEETLKRIGNSLTQTENLQHTLTLNWVC